MPTSKAERLLDLVIALLNTRYYRSAAWIRERVAGYGDAASDEAFSRMFERDKQELRDMGIPIETQSSGDGYRIRPGEFALPPMSFTPAESAALAVASRLWETTVLADAGSAALRKLRDAAGPNTGATGPAGATGPPAATESAATESAEPAAVEPAARGAGAEPAEAEPDRPMVGLQARLRTSEPAFPDLFTAIRARRAVRFDYRTASGAVPETRSLEPWGMVCYHGAWYVVGQDTVRGAPRTFRLSRITGAVTPVGRAGAVTVPPGVRLMDRVLAASQDAEHSGNSGNSAAAENADARSALLKVRVGRGAGIRRCATVLRAAAPPDNLDGPGGPDDSDAFDSDAFDEVQVPMPSLWDSARRIAGHGPDVVVIDPPELIDAVRSLLRGVAEAAS